MKNDKIIERIITLLKEQGKKQKDLTDHLGITPNAFTDWKSGRIKSYNKHLSQIADFLGVSVDYLLDEEQPLSNPKILSPSDNLSEHELSVINAYRQQPDLQPAVDLLLGITDNDKIVLYAAAHSDTNKPDGIILMDKEKWKKIQNAPETDDTLL